MPEKRKRQAKVLRDFRKIHRITGATLFVFFFFISVTGLLLGWKKNSNGLILSKTYEGTSTHLNDWLPLDNLYTSAQKILKDSIPNFSELELDRIDVRKNKGSVKFIYSEYLGIQLDGATGDLLHIEKRRADFIENIHDGSIIDNYLGTDGYIKLFYTTMMSLALLTFTITGFWLWYGPKRMRKTMH